MTYGRFSILAQMAAMISAQDIMGSRPTRSIDSKAPKSPRVRRWRARNKVSAASRRRNRQMEA